VTLPLTSPFTHGVDVDKPDLDQLVNSINALYALYGYTLHGSGSATVASGSPDGSFSVSFMVGALAYSFPTVPTVVATNSSTSNRDYGVQVLSKSTSGFTGRVHHWDGTNAGATINVSFDWIATAQ
jgi:hypothetical protein